MSKSAFRIVSIILLTSIAFAAPAVSQDKRVEINPFARPEPEARH